MNLLQINDNGYAIIISLPRDESGQRLEALGLRKGKYVHKISGMPWGGPITLELNGRHFAIAHNVAAAIQVRAAEPPAVAQAKKATRKNDEL